VTKLDRQKCWIDFIFLFLNQKKKQKKDSGTVDFEEFIGMMSKFRQLKTSNELEQELKEIFNVKLEIF
jgi:Ca2+-binding EF-hand superfamily protein